MMQWRLLGHESSSEILIISLGKISRNKIEFLEKKNSLGFFRCILTSYKTNFENVLCQKPKEDSQPSFVREVNTDFIWALLSTMVPM